MTKKKVIIVSIVALLALATVSVFAPVSVDKFLWGDDFEEYVVEHNIEELDYLITKENIGKFDDSSENKFYNKTNGFEFYYNSEINEYGASGLEIKNVDSPEFLYKTEQEKSVSYKCRHIYITAYFMYENAIHEIKFEGTRWFFGKYTWEMMENEFFPIQDENFYNAGDAVERGPKSSLF